MEFKTLRKLIMIERYSRKEIKSIWEDYNRYSIWLDIELAAAEAMEKLKIIPKIKYNDAETTKIFSFLING